MSLSTSEVIAITDSLGLQWAAVKALAGTSPAADVVTGADANEARVLALSNPKDIVLLLKDLNLLTDAAATPYPPAASFFGAAVTAVGRAIGGFSKFASDNGIQYSPDFRELANLVSGNSVGPLLNFKATTTDVFAVAVTAPGTGTVTSTGSIDEASYGPALMEMVATTLIGAAAIVATFQMKRAGGASAEERIATMPSGSASGTAIAIGGGTDRYVDVNSVAFTGGTAADGFKVRAKVPRTPSL